IRRVLRARKEFSDVTVSRVTVTLENSGRKKRSSLAKRQANPIVVLAVRFFIFFANICDYRCQLNVGRIFKILLQNNLPSALFLTNVPILSTSGEVLRTIPSIPITGVVFITDIYPGRYPVTPLTSRPTITTTTTSQTPPG
ncbi:unnamed protein product, partial [Rotaria sordida]